jgi:hypothetical protein
VRCKEGGELSVTEQNRTQWTPIPWHCRSFHPHGHGIIFLSFFIYFKDKKANKIHEERRKLLVFLRGMCIICGEFNE